MFSAGNSALGTGCQKRTKQLEPTRFAKRNRAAGLVGDENDEEVDGGEPACRGGVVPEGRQAEMGAEASWQTRMGTQEGASGFLVFWSL